MMTLDDWVARLGVARPPQPPKRYYLDPVTNRGALTVGEFSWRDAMSDYAHGCEVARTLSAEHYEDRFTTPWGESAIAAQKDGAERTALLPVEK